MTEEEEPPIQYYEIIEHKTISKRGRWWTLLTLLKDTEKDQTFLSIYKFLAWAIRLDLSTLDAGLFVIPKRLSHLFNVVLPQPHSKQISAEVLFKTI